MTLSSTPAGSNGQPNFEKSIIDDNNMSAIGPIKISIASSDKRSLNLFRCALEKQSSEDDKVKASLKQYSITRPFMDSVISPVELLTIPFQSASKRTFKNWNNFRSDALNFVYINKSDDQLPDVFLKSIENLKFHNFIFLFERGISTFDVYKHKVKISEFISKPFPCVREILFGAQDTVTKIENIILNRNDLESIEHLTMFSDEDRKAVEKDFKNYSCHTVDVVHESFRIKARGVLLKLLVNKFTEMLKENDEFLEFNQIFLNESCYSLSLEFLCNLKAEKVEKSLFETAKGSLEKYKDAYSDSNKIYKLCFLSAELHEIDFTDFLGKRTREEFESSLNTSEFLSTSILDVERQECRKLIKEQLFKTFEELLIEFFNEVDFNLTLIEHIEQKVKGIEAEIYRSAKNNITEYTDIFFHEKIKIRNDGFGKFLQPPVALQQYFGSKLSIPESKNLTSVPKYQWMYSGFGNDVVKTFQTKEATTHYIGPVDENGDDILEKLYRNSKDRIVSMSLPGFPQEVKVHLDEYTITFRERTLKAVARRVLFKNEEIEVPSYWSKFQDTMVKVKELNLNKLPAFEIGTCLKKAEFVDIVNEEIKEINPEATVKYVKRIQNFQHLENFHLGQRFMQSNTGVIEKVESWYLDVNKRYEEILNIKKTSNSEEVNKKYLEIRREFLKVKKAFKENERLKRKGTQHVTPYFFFHGSKITDPNEIIYDGNAFPLQNVHFDPNQNWGKGIQLSPSFTYANNCSDGVYDPEENVIVKRVYLVAAALGYSTTSAYDPSLVRPPKRGEKPGVFVYFDSVKGRYTSPKLKTDVYTVYDSKQVLPVLEICYTIPLKTK